jgi:hypothetical protein
LVAGGLLKELPKYEAKKLEPDGDNDNGLVVVVTIIIIIIIIHLYKIIKSTQSVASQSHSLTYISLF